MTAFFAATLLGVLIHAALDDAIACYRLIRSR
jgi:hypothetical protein